MSKPYETTLSSRTEAYSQDAIGLIRRAVHKNKAAEKPPSKRAANASSVEDSLVRDQQFKRQHGMLSPADLAHMTQFSAQERDSMQAAASSPEHPAKRHAASPRSPPATPSSSAASIQHAGSSSEHLVSVGTVSDTTRPSQNRQPAFEDPLTAIAPPPQPSASSSDSGSETEAEEELTSEAYLAKMMDTGLTELLRQLAAKGPPSLDAAAAEGRVPRASLHWIIRDFLLMVPDDSEFKCAYASPYPVCHRHLIALLDMTLRMGAPNLCAVPFP